MTLKFLFKCNITTIFITTKLQHKMFKVRGWEISLKKAQESTISVKFLGVPWYG